MIEYQKEEEIMSPIGSAIINVLSYDVAEQRKTQNISATKLTGIKIDASKAIEDRHLNRDIVEITGISRPVISHESVTIGDIPISYIEQPRQESTKFTNQNISETARILSALMDEKDEGIYLKICSGMSIDQLAEHFGNIGKQIDEAFAAGKITQQEFDDLNRGLEKYTETISNMSENETARWGVARQCALATQAKIKSGASDEEMLVYAENQKETFQDQIDQFIREYCSIDRFLLNQLMNTVRTADRFSSKSAE